MGNYGKFLISKRQIMYNGNLEPSVTRRNKNFYSDTKTTQNGTTFPGFLSYKEEVSGYY